MRAADSLFLVLLALPAACDPDPGARTHALEMRETHALPDSALAALRAATEQFWSVPAAEAAGYAAFGDCFQDPVLGGMGQHYANDALIADSAISVLRPELMVYQPGAGGELRLVAVEYLVFQDEWHARGHVDPPALFDIPFHLNTTLLPKPFYLLHAWVWRKNPAGVFADWNPRVRCPGAR